MYLKDTCSNQHERWRPHWKHAKATYCYAKTGWENCSNAGGRWGALQFKVSSENRTLDFFMSAHMAISITELP